MFVKLYLLSLFYYSNSCKTEYYIVYLQWVVSLTVGDVHAVWRSVLFAKRPLFLCPFKNKLSFFGFPYIYFYIIHICLTSSIIETYKP